ITFSITSGDGALLAHPFDATASSSITLNTNQEGLAWIHYLQGPTTGVTSSIAITATNEGLSRSSVSASDSSAQVSFSSSTAVPPVTAKSLAVGASHSLALYSDGTVWAWGDNTKGQLGDGTITTRWH